MKTKKIFPIIFFLTLSALLLLLVGCEKQNDTPDPITDNPVETTAGIPSQTTPDTSDASTTTPTTEIDFTAKSDFTIVKDGKAVCKIVCPANAVANETELAKKLADSLTTTTGINFDVSDTVGDDSEVEIVVGIGAYDKAAEQYSKLAYGQWAMRNCGNKLIVCATDNSSFDSASKMIANFFNRYFKDGELTLPQVVLTTETITSMPIQIPAFGGLIPSYSNAVGGADTAKRCRQVTFENVKEIATYDAYIEHLISIGFEKVAENTISRNRYTTLIRGNSMLTVDYFQSMRLMRVISEPTYETNIWDLPEGERKYAVTLMQIKDSQGNHPCAYVVTLADGRYFLYDTGFAETSSITSTATQLIEYMRQNNRFTDGKIHIAGIMISHPHPDHMGGLLDIQKNYSDEVICEAVMYNLVSNEMQSNIADSTLNSRQQSINDAAKALGAKVYAVRAGQKFSFAGTTFEILFTADELGNFVLSGKDENGASITTNDMNNSSLIMCMTESNQKITFMGDCRGGEATIANEMFKYGFPGNIMTVAHHGYNVVAPLEMYKLAKPYVLLWPIKEGDADVSRSFVKQLQAATYVKEHLYEDEQVVLVLPYTPAG